jgi:hypothetical protein
MSINKNYFIHRRGKNTRRNKIKYTRGSKHMLGLDD